MKKLYETITAKIVADLESGIRPSSMCWNGGNGIPRPLRANGEPYRWNNTLSLWAAAADRGFTAPLWMTSQQSTALGRHVRKGEKLSQDVHPNDLTA